MTLFDGKEEDTAVRSATFAQRSQPRRARISWMVARPAPAKVVEPAARIPSIPPLAPPPAIIDDPLFASDLGVQRHDSFPPLAPPEPPVPTHFSTRAPAIADSFRPPPAVRAPESHDDAAARALVERLESALAEFASYRQHVLASSEKELVALAAAIARRVVARELRTDPSLLLHLAHTGLEALAEADRVTVRLGEPLDDKLVAPFRDRLMAKGVRCDVRSDAALGPGGCVVETELGRVDESLQARLDSVLFAITSDGEGSVPP